MLARVFIDDCGCGGDDDRKRGPLTALAPRPLRPPRVSRPGAGVSAACACVAFLWIYAGLTVLHAAGRDPPITGALVPIPLFARFLTTTVCAAPLGVLAGVVVRDHRRTLRALPRILAWSIAFTFVAIVVAA
jgi:hypothetical protein